jgi:quercetin dioxygenase-like cupin family protein
MKKPMLAAAILAASTFAAFAADVSGAVKSIDAAKMTVTLDDGKTYTLLAGFDATTLKVGEKLTISVGDDGTTITKVTPAPTVETKGLTKKLLYDELLAGPLTEINGKYRMWVTEFTIAPGGYVGPHLHAAPGFRCLIAGEVTNIEADGKTTIYHPGECYWEAGDKIHTPYNKGERMVLGLQFELVPASFTGSGTILPVPAAK